MKKSLVIIFGLTALALSGCLIGAEPMTFKNDADLNATVQACLGGMAESSNGLCWRELPLAESIEVSEVDKSTICQFMDGTGEWRLPSVQEYIRLLGNCRNNNSSSYRTSEFVLLCYPCQESPICSQVFPYLEYSGNYLTSDNYQMDVYEGQVTDRIDTYATDNVRIMCVRPEPV